MKEKKKIVCIGILCLDILISRVDEDIFKRQTTDVDFIKCQAGGDALNESIIVSVLGHDSILMGAVGDDIWGEYIINQVKARGVDTSAVYKIPSLPTTVSTVLVKQNSERLFLVYKKNNAAFAEECLKYEVIASADAVSVGSIYYNEALDSRMNNILSLAKKNKALTFGDVSYRQGYTIEKAKDYLHLFDFFVPNFEEAKGLTGKSDLESIAGKILDYGVKNVIIKMGDKGCYIQNATDKIVVPAFNNDNVVDTTGAGDSFLAGFIAGTLEGLDLESAAVFASAAASINVQGLGAAFLNSRQDVEDVFASRRRMKGDQNAADV